VLDAERRRGGRRKAREIVMRVLYESEITGDDPREILSLAFGRFRLTEEGRRYAEELMRRCQRHRARLDEGIRSHLRNWSLERVGVVERAILRMAATELLYVKTTPARVILDEALRLARRYGAPQSCSFVNGVLDALGRSARPKELSGGGARPSDPQAGSDGPGRAGPGAADPSN
jgi:N utilization substance protein B